MNNSPMMEKAIDAYIDRLADRFGFTASRHVAEDLVRTVIFSIQEPDQGAIYKSNSTFTLPNGEVPHDPGIDYGYRLVINHILSNTAPQTCRHDGYMFIGSSHAMCMECGERITGDLFNKIKKSMPEPEA